MKAVRIVCQFLPLCWETFTLFLLLLHLLLMTVSQYSITVILGGLRSEVEKQQLWVGRGGGGGTGSILWVWWHSRNEGAKGRRLLFLEEACSSPSLCRVKICLGSVKAVHIVYQFWWCVCFRRRCSMHRSFSRSSVLTDYGLSASHVLCQESCVCVCVCACWCVNNSEKVNKACKRYWESE